MKKLFSILTGFAILLLAGTSAMAQTVNCSQAPLDLECYCVVFNEIDQTAAPYDYYSLRRKVSLFNNGLNEAACVVPPGTADSGQFAQGIYFMTPEWDSTNFYANRVDDWIVLQNSLNFSNPFAGSLAIGNWNQNSVPVATPMNYGAVRLDARTNSLTNVFTCAASQPAGSVSLRNMIIRTQGINYNALFAAAPCLADAGDVFVCGENSYNPNVPAGSAGWCGGTNPLDTDDDGDGYCDDDNGNGVIECPGLNPDPDCDDNNPGRNPGVPEICNDGIDNDCDGRIDGDDTDCPASVCGNNRVETGEQCDDGNTANGDGCSSTCQIESVCGNGTCEMGETPANCPQDCPCPDADSDGVCDADDCAPNDPNAGGGVEIPGNTRDEDCMGGDGGCRIILTPPNSSSTVGIQAGQSAPFNIRFENYGGYNQPATLRVDNLHATMSASGTGAINHMDQRLVSVATVPATPNARYDLTLVASSTYQIDDGNPVIIPRDPLRPRLPGNSIIRLETGSSGRTFLERSPARSNPVASGSRRGLDGLRAGLTPRVQVNPNANILNALVTRTYQCELDVTVNVSGAPGIDDDDDGDGTCDDDNGNGTIECPNGNTNPDCDDTNPNRFPGNPEICDQLDNDCDTQVDEGLQCGTDDDDDNDGSCDDDNGNGRVECGDDCTTNPDGSLNCPTDCDDNDPTRSPGLPEICGDGIDNDCDNQTEDMPTWHVDHDRDGYGDPRNTPPYATRSCTPVPDHVPNADDCDDTEFYVNPGMTEFCDEYRRDNDCNPNTVDNCDNGVCDPDVEDCGNGDDDDDGDTFCDDDNGDGRVECPNPIPDCNDRDPNVHPGATEMCQDGVQVGDNCNAIDDLNCQIVDPPGQGGNFILRGSGCSLNPDAKGASAGYAATGLLMLALLVIRLRGSKSLS